MSETIGSFEAQTHLPELLERVARGETITITDQGKPVAQLVPVPPDRTPDMKKVIEEFKAYSQRQGRTLEDITYRELVEEGRRY